MDEIEKNAAAQTGDSVSSAADGSLMGSVAAAPSIGNDHVAAGASLFTAKEIAANDGDAVSVEEAKVMFADNPGLSSVLTTEGFLHRDGALT